MTYDVLQRWVSVLTNAVTTGVPAAPLLILLRTVEAELFRLTDRTSHLTVAGAMEQTFTSFSFGVSTLALASPAAPRPTKWELKQQQRETEAAAREAGQGDRKRRPSGREGGVVGKTWGGNPAAAPCVKPNCTGKWCEYSHAATPAAAAKKK